MPAQQTNILIKMLIWILLGTALISFITLSVMAYVIGDPKSITTDINAPGIEEGDRIYLEPSKYELYRKTISIIHPICFICGILGMALLWWKYPNLRPGDFKKVERGVDVQRVSGTKKD